jgi:hypothetical protein
LASSIYFALKDAIAAARYVNSEPWRWLRGECIIDAVACVCVGLCSAESGFNGFFRTNSPLTSERIRMAAQDQHTRLFVTANGADPKAFQPFGSF